MGAMDATQFLGLDAYTLTTHWDKPRHHYTSHPENLHWREICADQATLAPPSILEESQRVHDTWFRSASE